MTLSEDRTTGLRGHRSMVSEDKHRSVHTAVHACRARGVVIAVAALAREAGVTETFLYRHQAQPCSICDRILEGGPISYYRTQMQHIADARDRDADRDGRLTAASVQTDLANQRATNHRLRGQIRSLETRLGELLGTRSQAGMTELARLAQDVSPAGEHRIRELSAQLRVMTEQLADRDEELDAVRRLNTELTRRLNSDTGRNG